MPSAVVYLDSLGAALTSIILIINSCWQIPHESAHVADVFSLMEQAKQELYVQAYSVHQTSLEQVFLTFTRKQVAPKDDAKASVLERMCCCCCMKHGVHGKKKQDQ